MAMPTEWCGTLILSIVWLTEPVYAVRPEDHVMLTHGFVKTPDNIKVGGVYNSTRRPLLATDSLQ